MALHATYQVCKNEVLNKTLNASDQIYHNTFPPCTVVVE